MDELEKAELIEQKLKEKAKQAHAKTKKIIAAKNEKLGRAFYKKIHAKDFTAATNFLNNMPADIHQSLLTPAQENELRTMANGLVRTGEYWRVNDIKALTAWVAQFRDPM